MFKAAVREIRSYPSRIFATVTAIAIAIGFLVSVSVAVNTEGAAWGKQLSAYSTKADVAVQFNLPAEDTTRSDVKKVIENTSGVEKVESIFKAPYSLVENGDKGQFVDFYRLPSQEFRWSELAEGDWPAGPTEIVLSAKTAKSLNAKLGDELTVGLPGVSETSEQRAKLVGLTNDPSNALGNSSGYFYQQLIPDNTFLDNQPFVIKVLDNTNPKSVVSELQSSLAKFAGKPSVNSQTEPLLVGTGSYMADAAVQEISPSMNITKVFVMVFGVVAIIVGAIIISTTFQILIAQRRRQIGLLRVVGASGSQVRKQFLWEALIIGVIGSLIGIGIGIGLASLAGLATGAIAFGLAIPPVDLVIEFLVGVGVTVIACLAPSLEATKVAPLEALRPVDTVEKRRKLRITRLVISLLFVALGVGLLVLSRFQTYNALALGLGAVFCFSVGVLASTKLFVPQLLKLFAKLAAKCGPTAKLAGQNSVRNPSRSAATATALMLAVGLIVCLQVGTATVRSTALSYINERYPIDITVSGEDMVSGKSLISENTISQYQNLPTVEKAIGLKSTKVTWSNQQGYEGDTVLGWTPEVLQLNPKAPKIDDQTVLISPDLAEQSKLKAGSSITVSGDSGKLTLKVSTSSLMSYSTLMVTQTNLDKLSNNQQIGAAWIKLTDRSDLVSSMKAITSVLPNESYPYYSGSAFMASILEQALNIILIIMTALLGVAVVVALVGVANTLGLSVVERTQETGMLRALGMQKSKLRLMLFIESLLLAGVGVISGFIIGSFFAWLMLSSAFTQLKLDYGLHFAIDPWQTIGLVLIAVLAACLASVGPGHRAARTSPLQAIGHE